MKFNWFKKSQMETISVDGVEFLGEQNGTPERNFKARMLELLDNSDVSKAYLSRVRYADGQQSIALCLSAGGAEKQKLVEDLSAEFKSMFRPDISLDILFLTPAQSQQIPSVCTPFFTRRLVQ